MENQEDDILKKTKLVKLMMSCAMTMAILATNIFATNVYADRVSKVNEDGLEAYWTLDGDLKDSAGANGRDLTVLGNESFTEGRYGKAFQLDGSTVLKMDGDKGISSENVTVAFWLKLEELPEDQVAMNQFISTEGLGALGKGVMDFGFLSGGLRSYVVADFMAGSGDEIMHGDNIWETFTDDWHHFAVVWDTDNEVSKMYVDGTIVNEAAVESILGLPIVLGTPSGADFEKCDLNIGGYVDTDGNATRTIKGAIDEIAIFSAALTDEEILKMATFDSDDTEETSEPSEKSEESKVEESKAEESSKEEVSPANNEKENGNATPYIIIGAVVAVAVIAIIVVKSKKSKNK